MATNPAESYFDRAEVRASAGDILAYRRKRAGLNLIDLVRADGRWDVARVAVLEARRTLDAADVTRYLAALERAAQEKHPR